MASTIPFHILAKPIGPICNLDCHYCFYLDRDSLFPQHKKASDFRMNDETLERYIQQYIQFQPGPRSLRQLSQIRRDSARILSKTDV
jgi:sulfatase maturation enzyme AslB (radical SAM superfamily)